MNPILGCDISKWQGSTGAPAALFDALHSQGVRFGIFRSSIGTKVDPSYAANRREAIGRDWIHGAYHFLEPASVVSPVEQARTFARVLVDGLAVVDMEWIAGGPDPSLADAAAFVGEFRKLRPGLPVGLYTALGFWRGIGNPDASKVFDYLMDARWTGATKDTLPAVPPTGGYGGFPKGVPFWQFGSLHANGRVIDGDCFYGTRDELAALGGVVTPDYAFPVDCSLGQWRGETYPGHLRWAVDINRGTGFTDFGNPVLASAAGTVAVIHPEYGDVWVNHAGGFTSKYGHMQVKPDKSMDVRVGQKVRQGDRLGKIGRTHPTKQISPHLHLEHARDGKPVRVSFHRQPFPASLNPATSKTAPLCAPTPAPPPTPGGLMRLVDTNEAGFTATLKPTAVIEDAAQVPIPGASPAGTFKAYGRTPSGRLAFALKEGEKFREAYARKDDVVSVVDPAAGQVAAAKKAGRESMRQEAILAVTGVPA